jgi:hypothetical protein
MKTGATAGSISTRAIPDWLASGPMPWHDGMREAPSGHSCGPPVLAAEAL